MNVFLPALLAVLILLAVAAAGFILKKREMVSEDCIPGLSKVMLYVCQPCLAVYTFSEVEFSLELLKNLGIFALILIAVNAIMLGGAYLILKRRHDDVVYRIITIATTFANCAFFGIPIIEAVMPDVASEVLIYTTVYGFIMNVMAWTIGCFIISRDSKYITVGKIFLNPAAIGTALAFIVFLTGITFPTSLGSMINTVGKMVSPLSMLIMGMRLATMELRKMFSDYRLYLTIAAKQFLMPAVAFLFAFFLSGVDLHLRQTLFITCACPVASIVLNFAEIVGTGQKEAANTVLLSTALSVITLPLMMLLFPLIT